MNKAKPFFRIIVVVLMGLVSSIPITAAKAPVQEPAAKLDQKVFNAGGGSETLLHINKPGRYSIQVTSPRGTQLTIVDRMAGPYHSSGSAGSKDGRLDLLLDSGTYKIRLNSYYKENGKIDLAVFPFREMRKVSHVEALPYLRDLELVNAALEDLYRQGFWIEVKERQVLRLEMMGRSLADARLWRDGSWLEDIQPTKSTFESVPGQPMTHLEFHHDLNPGLYLLTCYGGPAREWAKEVERAKKEKRQPFYLRMGIPYLGTNGQRLLEVSPFGRDTFMVSKETDFFQLVREEKKPARLHLYSWHKTGSRFGSLYRNANITHKSRDPWCTVNGPARGEYQWVTVIAPPGDPLELHYFMRRRTVRLDDDHDRYWISSIHSVEGRDAVDTTAVLTHSSQDTPVKAGAITITPKKPLIRKINLLRSITLFLFIEEDGAYVVDENAETGAEGRYLLKPFFISKDGKYKQKSFQKAGSDWELTAGYYELNINPLSRGILHFALYKKDIWLKSLVKKVFDDPEYAPGKKLVDMKRSLIWPQVILNADLAAKNPYKLRLNERGGVKCGVVVRKLPLDLQDPLPVILEPGQSVRIKVKHKKNMNLAVTGGSYLLKVDKKPWDGKRLLPGGFHHLELENRGGKARLFNLRTEEVNPFRPPPPVLKRLEDIFAVLTEKKPLFRDFDYEEKKRFLLQVKEPGLYRLETTGRMATAIKVRTRTITSLFSASQNGIGRNALVQDYLKPGSYLVDVQTLGRSRGRGGVHLRRTGLDDVAGLDDGSIKRCSVPEDAAVRYRVEIKETGSYHLETYSLGKSPRYRLDDAGGWPLMKPGKRGAVNRLFNKGFYFYYTLPEPVESRRVTFLRRWERTPTISGKGPHTISLNQTLSNEWLESPGRSPDIYRVEITAPIRASVKVTDGMEAAIFAGETGQIAATAGGKWSGQLPAGTCRLEVKSKEENNRQSYNIGIRTADLIPGLTQRVKNLPAQMNVSLAKDSPVDIVSFGRVDVAAVLNDDKEKTVTTVDDMPDDWNFRISRGLEAGRYVLKVSAAEGGSGSVEVGMNTREELVLNPQALPFSIKQNLAGEVLKIPFTTGEGETLLHIGASAGSDLKLVLMKGETLLAEAKNHLYIPLPAQSQYTLSAWDPDRGAGEVRVEGLPLKTRQVAVTRHNQTIPVGTALVLDSDGGLSFRLKGGGNKGAFYYSPALERPCLTVGEGVEGMKENRGWLVRAAGGHGRERQVRLEAVTVAPGKSSGAMLNDLPLTFALHHRQEAPLLLEVTSVNALVGAAVFPRDRLPDNYFQRFGMLAEPSRTLAGIPGKGAYRGHIWLTAPTPPLISEKNRLDTRERIAVAATAFPRQKQLDFRGAAFIEAQVEPGRSVWLLLAEEPQLLEMTLAQGLAAFSWHRGRSVDIAAALEKNAVEKMTVKGEILYVVNAGPYPARFRAEKRGAPGERSSLFDGEKGFETVFPTAGTLQFQLPDIPADMKLFAAGTRIESRLWGKDGKIYPGSETTLRKNFHMKIYEAPGGFLEIRHGPGLVKIWLAPLADGGRSLLAHGQAAAATPARLEAGMTSLAFETREWEFAMESPGYLSVETLAPTAMALVSGEKVLYMSLEASGAGHRLNHYLPAGTYRLAARQLRRSNSTELPGTLTLKRITPIQLDEDVPIERQIIRPGEIQVFRFTVRVESTVGVGLKSENDSLEAQLFDDKSRVIAGGPLMFKQLAPGTYLLVVKTRDVPVQYQPVILGTRGSREGVPEDVVQKYTKEVNR